MTLQLNDFDAIQKAIKILSYRAYSEEELRGKLIAKGINSNTVNVVIDYLCNHGYLDDVSLCNSLVEKYQKKGQYGIRKITNELRRRKISENAINQAIACFDHSGEFPKALKLAYQHCEKSHINNFTKIARYLSARGFTASVISKVLECIEQNSRL